MNELTKEELENIANALWIYDDMNDSGLNKDLIKKLQALIDNYCEHSYTEWDDNGILCSKCHTYQKK